MRCAAPETHGAVPMSRLAWMAAQAVLIGWWTYGVFRAYPNEPITVVGNFFVAIVVAAFLTALLTRCWDLLRLTALKALSRVAGEDRKADGKRLGTSPAVGLLRETGEQADRTRVSQ